MFRVFVVGCPRSGTSAFLARLEGSVRLLVLPETHFFSGIVRYVSPCGATRPRTIRQRVGRYSRSLRTMLGYGNPIDIAKLHAVGQHTGLNQFCDAEYPTSARLLVNTRFFVALLDRVASDGGYDGWVEKTPRHLELASDIEKYVPRAKFIHVVRDGRMTVASLYDAAQKYDQWEHLGKVESCVARWNDCMRLTNTLASDPNHMVVNYHRFVEQPDSVIREVAEFIGMDPVSRAEESEASCKPSSATILPDEPWKERVTAELVDTGLAKYEAMFDKQARQKIEAALLGQGRVDRF